MVVASTPTPGSVHGNKSQLATVTSGIGALGVQKNDDPLAKTPPPRSRGYDNQPGAVGNVLSAKVALALSPSEHPPERSGFPYVTPLLELCLESVARGFAKDQRCLLKGRLPDSLRRRIVNLLDTRLSLEIAGTWIEDEAYWWRRASCRWPTFVTKPGSTAVAHGRSWKQMYFEKDFEEAVVAASGSCDATDHEKQTRLDQKALFGRRWIRNVRFANLASDEKTPALRFEPTLFRPLAGRLTSLTITYGAPNGLGADGYHRSKFGMSQNDCESLSNCLGSADSLLTLALPNNFLDCKKVRIVARGLGENVSVTKLDLSHNHIGCRGVRAVAKLLDGKSILRVLDLGDNRVASGGAFALAFALKKNTSLQQVCLRLNAEIGDEGGESICTALRHASVNRTSRVESLNLSGCGLGPRSARAAALMIKCENSVLVSLHFAGNDDFGPEAGGAFRAAFLAAPEEEEESLNGGHVDEPSSKHNKQRPTLVKINSQESSKKKKPAVLPSVRFLETRGTYFPFTTFRRLISHTRLTLSFLSLKGVRSAPKRTTRFTTRFRKTQSWWIGKVTTCSFPTESAGSSRTKRSLRTYAKRAGTRDDFDL